MKRITFFAQPIVGLLLLGTGPQLSAKTYTLNEALSAARHNAPEPKEWDALTNKILVKTEGIDGAFDTTVYADAQNTDDKSKSLQPAMGDAREQTSGKIGVKKLFASGTFMDLNIESQKQQIDYPEFTSTNPNPAAVAQAQASARSLQVDPNPNFQNKVSFTISQSLWKNLGTKEVDLQKQIASAQAIAPFFTGKIYEQAVQAETEQLFWTLQKLNEQMIVAKNLVKKSKRFATLMEKRTDIGRADQVDVAKSESQIVFQEGNLLNLEIAADETRKKLAYRLTPQNPDFNLKIKANLKSNPLSLPVTSRSAALVQGKFTRLDLQKISQQLPAIQAERDLAKEQSKADISLWGNLSANGVASDNKGASEDLKELNQRTITIGISFSMPLGNTTSHSDLRATGYESEKLAAQKAVIERDFNREIEMAFTKLEAAKKRMAQSEKNVYSLDRQLQEERKKFAQARSDEISAIGFEMEVLAAKNNNIEALYMARVAESQIRMALHKYPMEKKK